MLDSSLLLLLLLYDYRYSVDCGVVNWKLDFVLSLLSTPGRALLLLLLSLESSACINTATFGFGVMILIYRFVQAIRVLCLTSSIFHAMVMVMMWPRGICPDKK